MRLTATQISQICSGTDKYFGSGSRVWLFGSRVDDGQKGGDIDLYIEPDIQDPAVLVDAKLHFLRDLHRTLGDQRIDVILRRSTVEKDISVYRIAKETGARLR